MSKGPSIFDDESSDDFLQQEPQYPSSPPVSLFEDGKLTRKLGDGASGQVYEYQPPYGDEKYAIKFYYDREGRWVRTALAEIDILFRVNNPFLIKGWELKNKQILSNGTLNQNRLFENADSSFAVVEDLKNGDLNMMESFFEHFQIDDPVLMEKIMMKFLCQMTSACNCLYRAKYLNADIKPENIFYEAKSVIVDVDDVNFYMGDFGLCLPIDREHKPMDQNYLGTLGYIAPEVLKNPENITLASCYWSIAISAIKIFFGLDPLPSAELLRAYSVEEEETTMESSINILSLVLENPIFSDGSLVKEILEKFVKENPTERKFKITNELESFQIPEELCPPSTCEYEVEIGKFSVRNYPRLFDAYYLFLEFAKIQADRGFKVGYHHICLALTLLYRLNYSDKVMEDMDDFYLNEACLFLALEFFAFGDNQIISVNEEFLGRIIAELGGKIFYVPMLYYNEPVENVLFAVLSILNEEYPHESDRILLHDRFAGTNFYVR